MGLGDPANQHQAEAPAPVPAVDRVGSATKRLREPRLLVGRDRIAAIIHSQCKRFPVPAPAKADPDFALGRSVLHRILSQVLDDSPDAILVPETGAGFGSVELE